MKLLYVAVVEVVPKKKERQDETQFTTKIDGFFSKNLTLCMIKTWGFRCFIFLTLWITLIIHYFDHTWCWGNLIGVWLLLGSQPYNWRNGHLQSKLSHPSKGIFDINLTTYQIIPKKSFLKLQSSKLSLTVVCVCDNALSLLEVTTIILFHGLS